MPAFAGMTRTWQNSIALVPVPWPGARRTPLWQTESFGSRVTRGATAVGAPRHGAWRSDSRAQMGVSVTLLIVLGVVAAFVLWRLSSPPLRAALEQARRERSIAPLVEAVESVRPAARTSHYNHAIRKLWEDYDRALAIELVRELASRHGSSLIAQYWLRQALQVEPDLASRLLPQEFLERHYEPEVAARCGPVG